MWHLHGYLTLAGALAWLGAVIALTCLISERRPTLGLFGGLIGLGSALGWALHLGFYTVPLSAAGGMADDNLDAAATVWAGPATARSGMTMVLFFIATQLLAHLVLGYGLWRAMIVPWWAAVCLPALPILVPRSRLEPMVGSTAPASLAPIHHRSQPTTDRPIGRDAT